MTERETKVAAVLAAANGELVGRIRLQKVVYLLDQLGFESGFSYSYYHYGPYSRDLENATLDATVFAGVKEKIEHRAGDGAAYSIFTLENGETVDATAFGKLGREKAQELVHKFKETGPTILELAATSHWVAVREGRTDWETEVRKRKNVKSQNGRLEKALELLKELQLPPAS
jgi:uncharacterized protein YwgA